MDSNIDQWEQQESTMGGHTSGTSSVCLVSLVYLVCLVHLVSFVQPNTRDRPNRPDRLNEQDRLAGFFSILLNRRPPVEE